MAAAPATSPSGQLQAGQEHFAENGSVMRSRSAAPVGGSVARAVRRHPGRSIRRICGPGQDALRRQPAAAIASQLQDAPVGLGRQMRAGFLLPVCAPRPIAAIMAMTVCPDRLADGQGFGIGLAGCGTVSLELIGISQRPGDASAERQVVGVQILQGAARLGNDGFRLMPSDRQRGPYGGDPSDKVAGLVVRLGALQGRFSRLQSSLRHRSLGRSSTSPRHTSPTTRAWHPVPSSAATPASFSIGTTAPRKCRGIPFPSIRRSARSTSLAAAAW